MTSLIIILIFIVFIVYIILNLIIVYFLKFICQLTNLKKIRFILVFFSLNNYLFYLDSKIFQIITIIYEKKKIN